MHVQSTWFPVIDSNPQVFLNIYRAKESDYRKAVQWVYRSRRFPSYLALSQIENMPQIRGRLAAAWLRSLTNPRPAPCAKRSRHGVHRLGQRF